LDYFKRGENPEIPLLSIQRVKPGQLKPSQDLMNQSDLIQNPIIPTDFILKNNFYKYLIVKP